MKKYDTIIAGGGPSGMTAALCCAKEGQRVLLIDRCDRVGRKILVTGNGRCNLTNMYQEADCYRGEAPERMKKVLSSFGLADALTFFHRLGICTRDKNGYIYPYNEQAASVREAFESALLARKNLDILTETSVTGMENTKEGFVVDTEDAGDKPSRKQDNRISRHKKQRFYCRSLIIATGGFAGVKLGCDGSGYEIAGKSGTGEQGDRAQDEYTITFIGYFPADDPKAAMLVVIDKPEEYADGVTTAAPVFGRTAEKILEYMGAEPETDDSPTAVMPDLTNFSPEDAVSELEAFSIGAKVIGEGSKVTSQFPAAGEEIAEGSSVLLYLK